MADETEKTVATPAADTTAAPVADEPKKIDPDQPEPKKEDPKPDDAKAKADEGDEETGDDQSKRKKLPGSAREKRRAAILLEENRALQSRLEALERQSPKADGGKDEAPKEEDFNGDWTAYLAAKSAHEARKAVREEFQKQQNSDIDRRQADARREREIAHLERIDEAREVITDFDEVMATMKGVTVRDDVIEEIKSSDKSHLLSYYLAKNPEKLSELNSLSGRELAREIGRLEGSVRMPAGKKVTTAPPPPANLKGGAAPHVSLEQVDDMNEFASRLRKSLEARKGRH